MRWQDDFYLKMVEEVRAHAQAGMKLSSDTYDQAFEAGLTDLEIYKIYQQEKGE